jgi:hypothetical protein
MDTKDERYTVINPTENGTPIEDAFTLSPLKVGGRTKYSHRVSSSFVTPCVA